MEHRLARGWTGRPKCWAFLRFQINQAVMARILVLYLSCTCKNLENKSKKSGGGEVTAWWNHVMEFQTQAISLQDQIAWSLHNSHIAVIVIWRRQRLLMEGSALLQALQMKCLILLGTRNCQMQFQNFLFGTRLELPAFTIDAHETSSL